MTSPHDVAELRGTVRQLKSLIHDQMVHDWIRDPANAEQLTQMLRAGHFREHLLGEVSSEDSAKAMYDYLEREGIIDPRDERLTDIRVGLDYLAQSNEGFGSRLKQLVDEQDEADRLKENTNQVFEYARTFVASGYPLRYVGQDERWGEGDIQAMLDGHLDFPYEQQSYDSAMGHARTEAEELIERAASDLGFASDDFDYDEEATQDLTERIYEHDDGSWVTQLNLNTDAAYVRFPHPDYEDTPVVARVPVEHLYEAGKYGDRIHVRGEVLVDGSWGEDEEMTFSVRDATCVSTHWEYDGSRLAQVESTVVEADSGDDYDPLEDMAAPEADTTAGGPVYDMSKEVRVRTQDGRQWTRRKPARRTA